MILLLTPLRNDRSMPLSLFRNLGKGWPVLIINTLYVMTSRICTDVKFERAPIQYNAETF
jgi:hypothetical protein